jgi:hypothetical protein
MGKSRNGKLGTLEVGAAPLGAALQQRTHLAADPAGAEEPGQRSRKSRRRPSPVLSSSLRLGCSDSRGATPDGAAEGQPDRRRRVHALGRSAARSWRAEPNRSS